jgi:hypothetical protein
MQLRELGQLLQRTVQDSLLFLVKTLCVAMTQVTNASLMTCELLTGAVGYLTLCHIPDTEAKSVKPKTASLV